MAKRNPLKHISIKRYSTTEPYASPSSFPRRETKSRNRGIHGAKIKAHIERIREEFEGLKDVDLPADIIRDDAIYVEFISDFNFELAFDSLDSTTSRYTLLSIKKESIGDQSRYRVNVMLTEGGISDFIRKVNEYINENTDKGNPKNNSLITSIESIQRATLKAFWTEPETSFPEENEDMWWEVWFRRKRDIDQNEENEKILKQLQVVGAQVGYQELIFPEHHIKLVKATPEQLSSSLLFLDNLAELRKPKETAEFFTNLNVFEKEEFLQDLKKRTENFTDEQSLTICLLDSGVQNQHPLLSTFLPNENMFSYKTSWSTHDGYRHNGHGTGMAGLALYGDLTPILSSSSNVRIFHQLESVKIYNENDEHDPKIYGSVTEEAVNIPIVSHPNRTRIYCMAVTSKDQAFYGRPSSWSAAVDKVIFGDEELNLESHLFLVSGGNVDINTPDEYPNKNDYESVHDPAQAFNAVTVGAYTEMDRFDNVKFPDSKILAPKGGMSPSNSTSVIWEKGWAVKPDIVMEGGNLLNQRNTVLDVDSLRLLTTNKQHRVTYFQTFGDTSGATALASHFAAQIITEYPELRPETIRGLIIHSSEWTDTMTSGKSLNEVRKLKVKEKKNILRSFGYGVPNLQKALYSAENSLTLIAEKSITPFKKDSSVKFNEIHFFELPWPREILQESLGEVDVKLNITLSYFIEPNPGSRRYSSNYSYNSHGLRFNVIKPNEDFETFRKRVNKNARDDGETGFSREKWVIGEDLRNKGSIHRDFCINSGADLATRNCIAVYPVSGWYKTRKKLEKYDSRVRYSLIISIEAPEVDVDIYTPISNEVSIEV